MTRVQLLALVAGAAFVAMGLWQMATAPEGAAPAPAAMEETGDQGG